ncbi:LPXTG cell wall anchor domain-containing protein [Micromonospora sp. NBC_00421]|uniref:LPXTG cell wall anchor domain-containing protein n=1 Tax=Micromonospora sp. NBC_00421 TaxID=2975976 RepID=UPI002E1DAF7D
MIERSHRRWLAWIGVAGVFLTGTATPALAAPTVEIRPYFQDTTLAPRSPGVSRVLILYADRPTALSDVSVRYDYRSLAGKITVAAERAMDCTAPEPGVLVCKEPDGIDITEGLPGSGIYRSGTEPVRITATDEAMVGDSGDVKVDLLVAGQRRGSYTSRIRVGEGVDLAGGPDTSHSTPPGGKVAVPLVVANVGDKAVAGFAAVFDLPYAVLAPGRFSNCLYNDDRLFSCQFDEEIPAGGRLATTLDLRLGKDTYAPSTQSASAYFMTRADFEDLYRVQKEAGARAAIPGSGPRLALTDASTQSRHADQTDVGPGNNYTSWSIKITGRNGTDLVAVGDTVQGGAGAVVTATVGFRNNGPATLDRVNGDYEAATHTVVELPPGTTATEVPDNCGLRRGTRTYQCSSGMLLLNGKSYTMDFRLRIDRVVPNARGAVHVNAPCECPGSVGFADDLRPANDRAWLTVNPASGQGAGDDGGLPVTGVPTSLFAALGALLLVVGGGGYLMSRHRRTRFVA